MYGLWYVAAYWTVHDFVSRFCCSRSWTDASNANTVSTVVRGGPMVPEKVTTLSSATSCVPVGRETFAVANVSVESLDATVTSNGIPLAVVVSRLSVVAHTGAVEKVTASGMDVVDPSGYTRRSAYVPDGLDGVWIRMVELSTTLMAVTGVPPISALVVPDVWKSRPLITKYPLVSDGTAVSSMGV
jgi:hypothetical protein